MLMCKIWSFGHSVLLARSFFFLQKVTNTAGACNQIQSCYRPPRTPPETWSRNCISQQRHKLSGQGTTAETHQCQLLDLSWLSHPLKGRNNLPIPPWSGRSWRCGQSIIHNRNLPLKEDEHKKVQYPPGTVDWKYSSTPTPSKLVPYATRSPDMTITSRCCQDAEKMHLLGTAGGHVSVQPLWKSLSLF